MSDRLLKRHYPTADGGMIVIDHPVTDAEADEIMRQAKAAVAAQGELDPNSYFVALGDQVRRLVEQHVATQTKQ